MKSEIVTIDGKVLHLGLAKGQLAPNIFLVGDPARAFKVAKRFDHVDCEIRNREYVTLTGSYQGLPVSVIGTGIGVDNVEIALVEAYAVAAFDFESQTVQDTDCHLNFIRIGTSAGVQNAVEPGTLAIATYALGLDNAGLYYDHPAADATVTEIERQAFDILTAATASNARFHRCIVPYASRATPEISQLMIDSADALNLPYVTGITAATPGFYGPSSRLIQGLSNTVSSVKTKLAELQAGDQKVVNLEMESSLLFHIAGHLGFSAGTVCPIISKPTEAATIFDYGPSVEGAISVALRTMGLLHEMGSGRER